MKLKFIDFEKCKYYTYATESFIFDTVFVLRIFQIDRFGESHIKTTFNLIGA